jgi:hypothetical protein
VGPRGELVAIYGVVFHVNGEQIVAALGAVAHDVFDEQSGRHSLADQSALDVSEANDYGVDLARGHQGLELIGG